MSRKQQALKAKAARRARIVEYIRDGLTVAEIAHREGIGLKPANDARILIAAQESLTIFTRPKPGRKALPHGMTHGSARFRQQLRERLQSWAEKKKYHPTDVAGALGLSEKQQSLAGQTPFNCDWTLSQIERLATEYGVDFDTFMKELFS